MTDFICPIKHENVRLTSKFGYRTHPSSGKKMSFHQGIDLSCTPNTDVKIHATRDGKVVRVGTIGTYGQTVILRHEYKGKSMDSLYAHLKNGSIQVKVGQKVSQGDYLGIMDMTGGTSTGRHLHFEIHNGEWKTGQPNAIDAMAYISIGDTLPKYKSLTDAPDKLESPTTSKNETITSYLEALESDSSFEFRKVLASIYKISNYTGTVNQNSTLLSKVKSDKSTIFRFYSGEVKDEVTAFKVKSKINDKYPSWTLHVVQTPNKKWQLKSGTFKGFESIIDASNKVKKLGYSANIKAD